MEAAALLPRVQQSQVGEGKVEGLFSPGHCSLGGVPNRMHTIHFFIILNLLKCFLQQLHSSFLWAAHNHSILCSLRQRG